MLIGPPGCSGVGGGLIMMWDKIIYPFPNFNDLIVVVISFVVHSVSSPVTRGPFTPTASLKTSLDKQSHVQYDVRRDYFPFPNFNEFAVEGWKWISNFILHFIHVIIVMQLCLIHEERGPKNRLEIIYMELSINNLNDRSGILWLLLVSSSMYAQPCVLAIYLQVWKVCKVGWRWCEICQIIVSRRIKLWYVLENVTYFNI